MNKFTGALYEFKKKTQFWKLKLNMENGIYICHIWIVDPSKKRGFPSF